MAENAIVLTRSKEEDELMSTYAGKSKGLNVPEHGWKISLAHKFKCKMSNFFFPPLSQLASVIPYSVRYLRYYSKLKKRNKRPCMDVFSEKPFQPVHGVPLGGIGCGSINRGWKGNMSKWHLKPGIYENHTHPSNNFIVSIRIRGEVAWQQVLNPGNSQERNQHTTWKWGFSPNQAYYTGLYPRAWSVYNIPQLDVVLTMRQISPVFPDNYKDTSLPVAVFAWDVENNSNEEIEVTICMCMENGGFKSKQPSGLINKKTDANIGNILGVEMMNNIEYPNMPFTLCIGVNNSKEGQECSSMYHMNPCSNNPQIQDSSANMWKHLLDTGNLPKLEHDSYETTANNEKVACAIACKCKVLPNSKNDESMDFALSWDMPTVQFGDKGATYKRRYTKFFTDDVNRSSVMTSYALDNYKKWEEEIVKWQQPVLDDPTLPTWYKSAIFNELYYISDGGSIWVQPNNEINNDANKYAHMPDVNKEVADKILKLNLNEDYGKFAYLEGHEYKMYNTYDVHFYASIALASLFPKIELSLQSDFAIAILQQDTNNFFYLFDGNNAPQKSINCVPHDLGCPDDEPWLKINSYFVHDTAEWKDLNPKFVLQIYRDFHLTKNNDFLTAVYPVCKIVMERSLKHDKDGDGLIENDGSADQTFDGWYVNGPSAYCGGLWIAALRCMVESSKVLNYEEDSQYWKEILDRAVVAYQKHLWNGKYWNYDSSKNEAHKTSIMADQLAGVWYLNSANINDVLPQSNINSACDVIYGNNVMSYSNGCHGAVNGMTSSGQVDKSSVQSDEVWTGVTYALAATLVYQNKLKEGLQTASGIYKSAWLKYGMSYQTPEAFKNTKHYRSLAYMRPLSIWGIHHALNKSKEKEEEPEMKLC